MIKNALTEEQHDALMDDMRLFEDQMPSVGIFWYDTMNHNLFGVHKKELTQREVEDAALKGLPFINFPFLHHQVWEDEYLRTQTKTLETLFKVDYTQIPRGRVSWVIDKFIVLVGNWAAPIRQELTELLEKEFSLPYFEFVFNDNFDSYFRS